mmetsp:Transcript_11377/g.32773  ORF Transcript_11377/g.32773 Transcript_11377/m.32773 type:complete len:130 (-) Transcript_11377:20-409(-)
MKKPLKMQRREMRSLWKSFQTMISRNKQTYFFLGRMECSNGTQLIVQLGEDENSTTVILFKPFLKRTHDRKRRFSNHALPFTHLPQIHYQIMVKKTSILKKKATTGYREMIQHAKSMLVHRELIFKVGM